MIKFYDICTRKTYEKNGEEKAVWLRCGTFKEIDDGKKFIELNHLPGTSFYVFEQKDRVKKEEVKEEVIETTDDGWA